MVLGLCALGAFVCFLCGAAAGQAGMVSKEKLKHYEKVAEDYREMWMERVEENSQLHTDKLRLENTVDTLQRAIRQSRRQFDKALPLEIQHVSS